MSNPLNTVQAALRDPRPGFPASATFTMSGGTLTTNLFSGVLNKDFVEDEIENDHAYRLKGPLMIAHGPYKGYIRSARICVQFFSYDQEDEPQFRFQIYFRTGPSKEYQLAACYYSI
jgi:hypothetical protein